MIFLVSVIIGFLFAYLGVKKSFFPIWSTFFNVIIAIYLGVMLAPLIASLMPAEAVAYKVLYLLGVSLLVFAVSQMLAVVFLTGDFSVSFPNFFNKLGAGILGFATGFLASSFIFFLFAVGPVNEAAVVGLNNYIDADEILNQAPVTPIRWAGKLVAGLSLQPNSDGFDKALKFLVKGDEQIDEAEPNDFDTFEAGEYEDGSVY